MTPIDEPAIFANGDLVGSPTFCLLSPRATETGIFAFGVSSAKPDSWLFFTAPLLNPKGGSLAAVTGAKLGIVGNSGAIQSDAPLGPSVFFGIDSPWTVSVYDSVTQVVRFIGQQPARPPAERLAVAKDGAVAFDDTTRGIFFIAPDASSTTIYTPTSPRSVFDVVSDSTDDSFAWLEGQEIVSGYTGVKLVTSPYSATAVSPKAVASISSLYNFGAGLVVNAGMALLLTDFKQARLIRLSDGWGWSIPAEAGDGWLKPVWVDDNEVWIAVGPENGGGGLMNGIVRLRRSDLGPATVPPN